MAKQKSFRDETVSIKIHLAKVLENVEGEDIYMALCEKEQDFTKLRELIQCSMEDDRFDKINYNAEEVVQNYNDADLLTELITAITTSNEGFDAEDTVNLFSHANKLDDLTKEVLNNATGEVIYNAIKDRKFELLDEFTSGILIKYLLTTTNQDLASRMKLINHLSKET